jgi:hypothetical protein
LQDVTGQLGSAKKPPKKGNICGDWRKLIEWVETTIAAPDTIF